MGLAQLKINNRSAQKQDHNAVKNKRVQETQIVPQRNSLSENNDRARYDQLYCDMSNAKSNISISKKNYYSVGNEESLSSRMDRLESCVDNMAKRMDTALEVTSKFLTFLRI